MALFFATGMLCNVAAALRLDEIDEPWAKALNDPSAVHHSKGNGSSPC
jgi:hypothetical protein